MTTTPRDLIETARRYIGYAAGPLGQNNFSKTVGYEQAPWSGAWIDTTLRESSVVAPSFTYTPIGLAESKRNGLVVKYPLPGDIVVYAYSSNSGYTANVFGMPACGLVTDTREYRTNGRFLTIDGNSLGSTIYTQVDGVHQKLHYSSEVIAFIRPAQFETGVRKLLRAVRTTGHQLLMKIRRLLSTELKLEFDQIQEAAIQQLTVDVKKVRPGTKNNQIATIQLALSTVVDLQGAEAGRWDAATASAFARFQLNVGRVGKDALGAPDLPTLKRLAKVTGLFTVSE